jgi:hypothetical protein
MKLNILDAIDQQRELRGFRSIGEILELTKNGNIVLDPLSTLISQSIVVGSRNVFYPGIILEEQNQGSIEIGDDNLFYPSTFVLAEQGVIVIGNANQFGEGGCIIKANQLNSQIKIDDHGRYLNGTQIMGKTYLGTGSQILGAITVQSCSLEGGEDFLSSDPDLRGAVLKGAGLARNLVLERGKVINGQGNFANSPVELQSSYHRS